MSINEKPSRRHFMQLCCFGAAGLATPAAWAEKPHKKTDVFRANAKPLLLNYNENSLGMSPQALAAAQLAASNFGNRYPDQALGVLRETIADVHNVDKQQVIFGNGSTEVIQAVVTVAAGKNAAVIEPTPTFGDVRRYSRAEGLKVIQVPAGKGFKTDISMLREQAEGISGPVLINICNPNNPTGTIVDQDALADWINGAPDEHMFLIDEAYYEYAITNPRYSSVLPQIKAGRENVVITRTFSKIYGMAGMRIGYGIAAPKTAKEVRKFAAGYNLNAAGIAAARASLTDQKFYQRSLKSNQQGKKILLRALDELSLKHIESNTNFVLHKISSGLADYARRMLDNNVKVGRRMTTEDGWNRLSIGTPAEMQEFATVLNEFRSRGWL